VPAAGGGPLQVSKLGTAAASVLLLNRLPRSPVMGIKTEPLSTLSEGRKGLASDMRLASVGGPPHD